MPLRDYFRPTWKHSDPKVREQAVRELSDQTKLADVALTDNKWQIRWAAVERLNDRVALGRIVEAERVDGVRRLAESRRQQLFGEEQGTPEPTHRGNQKKSVSIGFLAPGDILIDPEDDTRIRILIKGGYQTNLAPNRYKALTWVEEMKAYVSDNRVPAHVDGIRAASEAIGDPVGKQFLSPSQIHRVDQQVMAIVLPRGTASITVTSTPAMTTQRVQQLRAYVSRYSIPNTEEGIGKLFEACPLNEPPTTE